MDLPVDFIAFQGIARDILVPYSYPCRIKAGLFVLCTAGEIRASVNLNEVTILADSMLCLSPGSIIEFRGMSEDLSVYVIGFSSKFLDLLNLTKSMLEFYPAAADNPVFRLTAELTDLYADYFRLLCKASERGRLDDRETLRCVLSSMLVEVGKLLHDRPADGRPASRAEAIYRELTRLVMRHFASHRQIAFYAGQLRITPQHLSATVRKVTGRSVSDVIADVVVTDAKAKLKSTEMTVQEISDSLGFPNVSFFGRYFKRYAGASPNRYRKS